MTDTATGINDPMKADLSARTFRRAIVAVLGVGLIALAVMAGVAFWLVGRAQEYSRWTDHTYVVESHITELQALIEQAETARRGYLLVPNAVYQTNYETLSAKIPRQLNLIAIDTMDNPVQRRNMFVLRMTMGARDQRVAEMMALAASGQADAAVASFKHERDQQSMARIRAITASMLGEEDHLLKLRTAREKDNAGILLVVVLIGAGLLAVLSIGSMMLMRRYASDLDQAQSRLRRLNLELESRVKSRTAELSRANDEIQRFAYIVSHDLRSPLVNVMGFTSELEVALKPLRGLVDWIFEHAPERLTQEVKDAVELDMPEAIGFIRSSTRKMDGLINAILRLSREGRRNLTTEPLMMNVVVSGLIDSVRHRLSEKGADAVIEGTLPDMTSDRLAIEQVFGNLIDNAVKYLSPARPGEIVIRGRRDAELLIYEVQDNGRGVSQQDHERIFELFRRAGAQDQTGEGIGLAHVRALMYRLGGTITCISELDRGATFRLSFPPTLSTTAS
jgi:signal transduction histidine kinase